MRDRHTETGIRLMQNLNQKIFNTTKFIDELRQYDGAHNLFCQMHYIWLCFAVGYKHFFPMPMQLLYSDNYFGKWH